MVSSGLSQAIGERAPQSAPCEVREASYLASGLRAALDCPGAPTPMAAGRLRGLEELITGHRWWRRARLRRCGGKEPGEFVRLAEHRPVA